MPSTPTRKMSLEDVGILPSHGITLEIPGGEEDPRPPNLRHMSSPAYGSPLRHHRRKRSTPRVIKETVNARSSYSNSQDDGGAIHRINQYVIKQEIGRGSFGAVHLAVDQHGIEYAVKEFSKSRLRKRAQSNILRRPHNARRAGHLAAGSDLNSPLHRHSGSDARDQTEAGNSLYLIKEEIAIMKKLNHPNLVSLIEVLDDPTEDSLYMVLEMCKKGVIMKVGVDERADPYDSESCRCWFRDLVLGIEYLHAQGVVHRDIKPDNLLVTEDDVLKIVDFGISEMFEKSSEMLTAKSAGSPAFLPPELCVARHGGISGKAADIWSMGVTLYCLRFGQIPFEEAGVYQLYESIKGQPLKIVGECEDDFRDLIMRLLEKDPSKRVTMPEIREHSWVTRGASDPLPSVEENTADLVEPPTEEEMNSAITGNLSNLLVVMRAAKRFKNLLFRKRPHLMESILGGKDSHFVQPPQSMKSVKGEKHHHARSVDSYDRKPIEGALVAEGVHRDINLTPYGAHPFNREDANSTPKPFDRLGGHDTQARSSPTVTKRDLHADPAAHHSNTSTRHREISRGDDHGKGHAHDPLSDHLFLGLGPGGGDRRPDPDPPVLSESPPAANFNIYEHAYHLEVERIRSTQGKQRTLFLTRRVNDRERYEGDENIIDVAREDSEPKSGIAKLFEKARTHSGNSGTQHQEDNKNSDAKDKLLEPKSDIAKLIEKANADAQGSNKEYKNDGEATAKQHKPSEPKAGIAKAVEKVRGQPGNSQEQFEKKTKGNNNNNDDQIRWSEIGEFTHALTGGDQDIPEIPKDEASQKAPSHKRQRSGIDRILELARQKEDDKAKKLGRSSLGGETVPAS